MFIDFQKYQLSIFFSTNVKRRRRRNLINNANNTGVCLKLMLKGNLLMNTRHTSATVELTANQNHNSFFAKETWKIIINNYFVKSLNIRNRRHFNCKKIVSLLLKESYWKNYSAKNIILNLNKIVTMFNIIKFYEYFYYCVLFLWMIPINYLIIISSTHTHTHTWLSCRLEAEVLRSALRSTTAAQCLDWTTGAEEHKGGGTLCVRGGGGWRK